jgi:prolipoprotein diacylglyceryltransferase
MFAMGFILSQQVMYYIYKQEGKPQSDIDTVTVFLIIAVIVGARLGHVIFYEPSILLERPLDVFLPVRFTPEFKFVGLQGLASHGGGIGIFIALWLYSKYDITVKGLKIKVKKITRKGQSYFQVLDRIAIVIALTGCLIRMGNFVNSEIVGKPTESDYGVVFARNAENVLTGNNSPLEVVSFDKRSGDALNGYQPITIQATFKDGDYDKSSIEQYIEVSLKNTLSSHSYVAENIYQPADLPIEFSLEQKGGIFVANISSYGIARHPAQLYESISYLLIFILLFSIWRIKKQDTAEGRIFGLMLIIMFGLRFSFEFIKENQVAFEEGMSLNMGQWLSIPLIILGIVIFIRSFSNQHESTLQSSPKKGE